MAYKNFLNKHSETLKEIILKDTRLHGSHLEELFRFMRENVSLGNLGLEGRLCEFKDGLKLEPYKGSEELELTLVPWESGIQAKRSIVDFVTRKSDHYPHYVLRSGYLPD
jgi:hypothetical protein